MSQHHSNCCDVCKGQQTEKVVLPGIALEHLEEKAGRECKR